MQDPGAICVLGDQRYAGMSLYATLCGLTGHGYSWMINKKVKLQPSRTKSIALQEYTSLSSNPGIMVNSSQHYGQCATYLERETPTANSGDSGYLAK
jgi:hypothetical protein